MPPDTVDYEDIIVLITNHTLRATALLMVMKEDLMPKMLTFQGSKCFTSKFLQISCEEQH